MHEKNEKAITTTATEVTESRDPETGKFLKGHKGSSPTSPRLRFSQKFIADLLADWEQHGANTLKILRIEKPAEYARIAASILPREIDVDGAEQLVINIVKLAT